MKSVKAGPFTLFHAKVSEEGEKPLAKQPRVTVSPVPEPHCIRGNNVGLVEAARKGKKKIKYFFYQILFRRQMRGLRQ